MGRLKTIAIVAAGGAGKRLGHRIAKPFVRLRGKPLIEYCLDILEQSSHIDALLIAIGSRHIKRLSDIVAGRPSRKSREIIAGGPTRFHSVRNCIERVDRSYDIVLIHDAARPFITEAMVRDSIRLAGEYGACVVSVPEKETVKSVTRDSVIEKTLERDTLWRAQTPQVFRRSLIVEAYKRAPPGGRGITDDSMLVERIERRVKVLAGSYRNIKITTREDLALAEALL